MGLRSIIEKRIKMSRLNPVQKELLRISGLPNSVVGSTNLFGKPFKFHNAEAFVATYNEIFVDKIYQFKSKPQKNIILDCGANMGLSVVYFSQQYPNHQIFAFEPDVEIFNILKENVETLQLKNVTLLEKAVWNKEEVLEFYTDHGMGGRVLAEYKGQEPTRIQTVRLLDYLSAKVDFLKLDIEGAEDVVLKDCAGQLSQIGSIFFEYHNDINKPQTLDELLTIIKNEGYHYYIKESAVRVSPYSDTNLICESFDMCINVFCYK